MKIAVISDTHLGYARFEEDSFVQAQRAIEDASQKADIIIHAGDIFDVKNPKLETIHRAIEIFKKAKIPVFAIYGNHERRSRDLINPVQLLASTGLIRLIHGKAETFEKNGEKIQVFFLGNVPEELAEGALKKSLEGYKPDENAFKILVTHQSIRELLPGGEHEISLEYLETLPFDLIINGHIHKRAVRLNGRFIMPGSTVITQLKKDEVEPRAYLLYDTRERKYDFIDIECRKFFYEEMKFDDSNANDVRHAIEEKVAELRGRDKGAIIRIKINGTMKEGLETMNLALAFDEHVYIDNSMSSATIGEKIRKIRELKDEKLSVRDVGIRELDEKIRGKITMFNAHELFDKLAQGSEETIAYLESNRKKEN